MRKSSKIIAGLAFAGLAAAGGSALTGSGLTNNAGSTQFVGGTVSQSFTGASLESADYTYTDTSNTAIETAVLTFGAGSDGKAATIAFTNAGGATGTFVCEAVGAVTTNVSTCTSTVDAANVTSAAITVS